MQLFDAHNHLQAEELAPFRPAIIRDLRTLPLGAMVVNGTQESDWGIVAALSREYPWVLPSYGLHPWYLAQRSPRWEEHLRSRVEATLAAGERVGIGETGLDRWMRDADFEAQQSVFRTHLRLATKHNLPLSIHCLRAWGRLEEILREEELPARGFLLHAYGGPVEMVPRLVELGAYFSFSGNFLHQNREGKRAPFREIPDERLLAETDAPSMSLPEEKTRFFLTPPTSEPSASEGAPIQADAHGPLNHPGNIIAVYEGLAALRGWSTEVTARQLAKNFERLFLQAK